MRPERLGADLVERFSRIAWWTAGGYAILVVAVFVLLSELEMRRALERSADVLESVVVLYDDPGRTTPTVALDALAERLLEMGQQFAITRTVDTTGTFFLSPTMPAERLDAMIVEGGPAEVREAVLEAIAERARWRYRIVHRAMGEFDIYVVASRVPFLTALGGLAGAALVVLPLTLLVARRRVQQSVEQALAPLERVASQTRSIGPDDLDRRIDAPDGPVEVRELGESINRMLDRVDRANRALRSFTADASHELRTPLTLIRAQVQWAQSAGRTPGQMHDTLVSVERELDRTTKMVEDLLLIARGENRQLLLTRQTFDLAEVVREVHEIGEAMVQFKDIRMHAKISDAVLVRGDPDRTRHILLNLVSNAVRYTRVGSVMLLVEYRGEMGVVDVRDTGPGIAPEHRDKIFDRFYRVDPSRSRAHGGAGLGLTIARVLSELQDGRIVVDTEVQRGSTFTLMLPRAGN